MTQPAKGGTVRDGNRRARTFGFSGATGRATGCLLSALLVTTSCNAPSDERRVPAKEDAFGHGQTDHDQGARRFRLSGTIVAIDEERQLIRINHVAIPELGAQAGTTDFRYRDPPPGGTQTGDAATFELEIQGGRPIVVGFGSALIDEGH